MAFSGEVVSSWPTVSVIAGGTATPPACRSGCNPQGWSLLIHSSPPSPTLEQPMVFTWDSCSLPPPTWSQVHLSCTFSGLASDVHRAPSSNNEGLMKQGKSLERMHVGEGNGWPLALGLCGTRDSLSRGQAPKMAVSVAPWPPESCRQNILSPLSATSATTEGSGLGRWGLYGCKPREKGKAGLLSHPLLPLSF